MENSNFMKEDNRIPKVIHYVWLGGGKDVARPRALCAFVA